jgi:hypothetical protein
MVYPRRVWLLLVWAFALTRVSTAQESPEPAPDAPDASPAPAEALPESPPPPADATPPAPAPTLTPQAPRASPARAAPDPNPKKQKGKQKKPGRSSFFRLFAKPEASEDRYGHVWPTGRVFVRSTLARHYEPVIDASGATHQSRIDSFDLSVPSARAGLVYDAPVPWLRANVELELTGKPRLTDAWLRARLPYLTAKVGQFKLPFSAIEMESAWSLPTARRGLLHDALVDELEVAGRRPGVTLEAHGRGKIWPSLSLGAFQASVLVDDDPDQRDKDLLSNDSLYSQSFVARAELRIHDVVAALGYESRLGTPELLATKHYATGGADVTLDTELRGVGLRIWAEGMLGSSWLENWYKPPDGRDTLFWATRLVTAVRFGGRHQREFYVEPYGMLGLLDPDTEVLNDILAEEVLGVNVGLWKLARVGLELELEHVERNFPQTYYLGDDPDRVALVVQAACEF